MIRNIGLLLLAIFTTLVFLISGVIINLLQGVLYITLYNTNRSLYRKLNYYLIYMSWIQILGMCEWWSNTRCNLWGDEEALRLFGKEHCLIVMNHKYDVDWLMCWFICDKLGMLGNAKTLAKKSLRNVPIIGWGWVFAEMIFLERNWEKDKVILRRGLSNLAEYEDPVMILYFCEGTRFTPEKHKASMEFAKARNLPQLKHHLCPRTSGFNFAATHLKDKVASVYDVQLCFPESPVKTTFLNMLRGYSFCGDIHIRRIPMSEIPTDSDEATSKWLHQLYQEKDQLMDDYLKTKKFPGQCVRYQRSYRSLINSLFWVLVVGVPFLYFLFKLLTMGNFWVTSITITIIILLFSSMYIMVRATRVSKGSSYGKDKSPTESSNGSEIHDTPTLQTKNLQSNQEVAVEEQIMSTINHHGVLQEQVINYNIYEEDIRKQEISKNYDKDAQLQIIHNEKCEDYQEDCISSENHNGCLQQHAINNDNHENVPLPLVINNDDQENIQKQLISSNSNEEYLKLQVNGNEDQKGDIQKQVTSQETHEENSEKL